MQFELTLLHRASRHVQKDAPLDSELLIRVHYEHVNFWQKFRCASSADRVRFKPRCSLLFADVFFWCVRAHKCADLRNTRSN